MMNDFNESYVCGRTIYCLSQNRIFDTGELTEPPITSSANQSTDLVCRTF